MYSMPVATTHVDIHTYMCIYVFRPCSADWITQVDVFGAALAILFYMNICIHSESVNAAQSNISLRDAACRAGTALTAGQTVTALHCLKRL